MLQQTFRGYIARQVSSVLTQGNIVFWMDVPGKALIVGAHAQAAEQGDAGKVGKKRKKGKGKAGEEELFEERGPADRAAALREAGTPSHRMPPLSCPTRSAFSFQTQQSPLQRAALREAGTTPHKMPPHSWFHSNCILLIVTAQHTAASHREPLSNGSGRLAKPCSCLDHQCLSIAEVVMGSHPNNRDHRMHNSALVLRAAGPVQDWKQKAMMRTTTQTRMLLMVMRTRVRGLLQTSRKIRTWRLQTLQMVRPIPGSRSPFFYL